MSKKPIIGVTGPDKGGGAAWFFTRLQVKLAGGKARRITPSRPARIDEVDGLVIGGGADVDPERYGKVRDEDLLDQEEAKGKNFLDWVELVLSILLYPIFLIFRKIYSSKSVPLDKPRDELEFRLLKEAVNEGIPVMGICRGMQLMNIHLKGDLHQNIKNFYVETPQVTSIFPKKLILIAPDSCLYNVFQTTRVKVNALHNQAVDKLGDDVVVVAKEPNDVVQGIEYSRHPFMIGVQWHPEYLVQKRRQRALFRRLVEESGQAAA